MNSLITRLHLRTWSRSHLSQETEYFEDDSIEKAETFIVYIKNIGVKQDIFEFSQLHVLIIQLLLSDTIDRDTQETQETHSCLHPAAGREVPESDIKKKPWKVQLFVESPCGRFSSRLCALFLVDMRTCVGASCFEAIAHIELPCLLTTSCDGSAHRPQHAALRSLEPPLPLPLSPLPFNYFSHFLSLKTNPTSQ